MFEKRVESYLVQLKRTSCICDWTFDLSIELPIESRIWRNLSRKSWIDLRNGSISVFCASFSAELKTYWRAKLSGFCYKIREFWK